MRERFGNASPAILIDKRPTAGSPGSSCCMVPYPLPQYDPETILCHFLIYLAATRPLRSLPFAYDMRRSAQTGSGLLCMQVKHVLSGETRYFRDWAQLTAYLEDTLQATKQLESPTIENPSKSSGSKVMGWP